MIRPSRFFACRALALLALLFALPAQAAFTDNGDGTVTDTVTGLMWDKCSWGQSNNTTCADTAATTHTWAQALGVAVTANAMNSGVGYKSHNDWRLPNKNELESLVKIDTSNPAIDAAVFPNTASSWYWTSTNYAPVPAYAWYVYFNGGGTDYDDKAASNYVRLVRSGQLFDSFDSQAADTVPDAFTFTAQTGAALSSVATSDTLTVAGINSAANISIAGGTYSINGGSYTSSAGTVNNGDTVTVQQTSSASFSTLTIATLTIGGVSGAFDVTTLAQDTTPAAFSFTAQTGAALSSVATSNTIAVAGINSAANISIAGGTYSINGGAYTALAGTVNNGATVTVQQTSSASYSTLTIATLTIGGVAGAFDVTTLAADTTPDAFTFTAQTGAALSSVATSDAITVAGINSAANISIAGGTYSINGGGYTAVSGTVNNGDTVTVQQTASASYNTLTTATLTIGGVAGTFDVTTLAASVATTSYTAPSATATGNITASFTGGGAGCGYTVSQFIPLTGHAASPPAGTAPAGVSFPHGLFDFTTGGCTSGSTITMVITYPQALPAGTVYWKYGPTPTDGSYHWYQLPATIAGNTATFSITDGGLGDDDLTANGTIVDQGGPGDGGGAASIPTLSEWALLMLAGLMGLFGMGAMRRRAPL